jgi:hypothetical protein
MPAATMPKANPASPVTKAAANVPSKKMARSNGIAKLMRVPLIVVN